MPGAFALRALRTRPASCASGWEIAWYNGELPTGGACTHQPAWLAPDFGFVSARQGVALSSISLWAVMPALYLAAFGLVLAFRRHVWPIAQVATVLALGGVGWALATSVRPVPFVPSSQDAVGLVMASLVALLGWVIVRFSWRYLEGEAGQERYVAALMFTFASVSTLVLTRDLVVLVLAWTASSLSLHHLLTFHADRAPAQIVAHKKFLASRMAEICLVAALVLIWRGAGTLELEGIAAFVRHAGTLPVDLHAAAILVALAAILKSAQLPIHGWLIQVMEAPTPVSALQHAGVVNIGGFVLIRLADLVAASPAARWLLVLVGSLTAVLAGLVMMTRISIKVRLAWSTVAQMGFMLMECGLGLFELAMLHLLAHSLYKGYAFLASGETVYEARLHDLTPTPRPQPPVQEVLQRLLALPVALGLVAASVAVWSLWQPLRISPVVLVVLGVAFAPLLWGAAGDRKQALALGLLRVLMLTQLYLLWHLGFGHLVPEVGAPTLARSVWVATLFGGLYVAQIWILAFPRGEFATRLFPWAYNGFYLDERFTRLTFRVWPARMSVPHAQLRAHPRPTARLDA